MSKIPTELSAHPIADTFPHFEPEDFERLKANIDTYGLLVPIVVYNGQILDGRNRYRACKELNTPALIVEFEGTVAQARQHAYSLNVLRRHLSQMTIGLHELALAEDEAVEAAERVKATHLAGKSPEGEPIRKDGSSATATWQQPNNQALDSTAPQQRAKTSIERVAHKDGPSARQLARIKIIKTRSPDLIPVIEAGDLTIKQAVDKIRLQESLKAKQLPKAEPVADAPQVKLPANTLTEQDRAAKAAQVEWESLRRALDILPNIMSVSPTVAALMVPAAARARTLKLLAGVQRWSAETIAAINQQE